MVFVVDTEHKTLSPCHPARARKLLATGKAAVWRHYPFTIILKRSVADAQPAPLRIKIDPGSTTTGLAVISDTTGRVVWAAELAHRGLRIRSALLARRMIRRARRQRHTRYRPVRFANRRRQAGWLPPSLASRVANVTTWVARLRRLCPIGAVSVELVRFDTQLLQHPDITGMAYQQGELAGYEVREYLLEKWGRQCAYCNATHVPLQIEHVMPKSRGGSDRVSNLTLACELCNQAKGNRTAGEFGHPEVQVQAKQSLHDAAAVNTTRWALYHQLVATGLPIEIGTGGRTKWNRTRHGLPKTHWLDAACVGASTPESLRIAGIAPLCITATGHGSRQMCGTDRFGFPVRHRTGRKVFRGFETGDIVRAIVPAEWKTAGRYVGRVLVRASGYFDLAVPSRQRAMSVHARHCQILHHCDGYSYGSVSAFKAR